MQKITFETYAQLVDSFRKKCITPYTNIYLTAQDISEIFIKKECLFFTIEGTLFILVPYHKFYYDLLFYTISYEALNKSLQVFIKQIYNNQLPIRASLIGKEPSIGELSSIFEKYMFHMSKKLGRINYNNTSAKNEAAQEFFQSFKENNKNASKSINPMFAAPEDAQAVLDMLLEEFDLCGENVPELEAIKENIEKKQVVIAKKDNNIIALHYFTIKNKIRMGIYEYVKKDFRGSGVMFYISNFIENYLKDNNIQITRVCGWRDITKKRLIKVYKSLGENFDGVYIYNLIFSK